MASTRPITEFAFNVLHRLNLEEASIPDPMELIAMRVVERSQRAGIAW